MNEIDKAQLRYEGLKEGHAILQQILDELIREHRRLPSGIFGGATRRHHQIIGASRSLKDAGQRFVDRGNEIIDEVIKNRPTSSDQYKSDGRKTVG